MRPLPSPLTDGGSFPSSLKTYITAYNTGVAGSTYGNGSASVQVAQANDEWLHPRTALPLDIACWSSETEGADLHLGPVHVGNDSILFDSGCVSLRNGTHTYYFIVTPGSFSCKFNEFLPYENGSEWLGQNEESSDQLNIDDTEAIIDESDAASSWRGQDAAYLPRGVQDSLWDYALRFVAFPGCGCSSSALTNAAIKIKAETVSLEDFYNSQQSMSGTINSDGCLTAGLNAFDGSGVGELPPQDLSHLTWNGSPCTPICTSGTLHFDVPHGDPTPSSTEILSFMDSRAPKESITVQCPSCGSTSVEIPHDVAKMIVENSCFSLVKYEDPCCSQGSIPGADRDVYKILPRFSTSICAELRNEVVCAPSCCLAVGTMVATVSGTKPAEEVRPGDVLISKRPISSSRELDIPITSTEIRDIWPEDSNFIDHLVVVSEVAAGFEGSYLVINGVLKLTAEHAMPINRNGQTSYKSASGIEVGDMIMASSGAWQFVYSVEISSESVATISLSTSGGNLYFADGYLVHNSDAGFIDAGFDFGGAAGLSNASGVDEISALERFSMLRSKIKVEVGL